MLLSEAKIVDDLECAQKVHADLGNMPEMGIMLSDRVTWSYKPMNPEFVYANRGECITSVKSTRYNSQETMK